MQILLADAKTMRREAPVAALSVPAFAQIAASLAEEMATHSSKELQSLLDISPKVSEETWMRYRDFGVAPILPAIYAYTGQAYRHLRVESLSGNALLFAQKHLFITSFLYGLLRPMDGIVPYRMEHSVRLEGTGGRPVSRFWRDKLTAPLLASVKGDDGVLVHLSTEEFEQLFDWKAVSEEIRIVKPRFYVRNGGVLKVQAVWVKSCRGAMLRYLLERQPSSADDLKGFSYEGFAYADGYGDDDNPYFIREVE